MSSPSIEEEDDDLGGVTLVTREQSASSGSPTPSSLQQLIVITDKGITTHALSEAVVSIGRSTENTIRIPDASISRRHATLRTGANMSIEDLGSANGTRVRGQLVPPRQQTSFVASELVVLGSVSVIVQQPTSPTHLRRLWTQGYFEARVDEECARAERSGAEFGLVWLQVGANADENAIQEMLADLLRASDVVGTCGPGEYNILLVDVTAKDAEEVRNRIAAAFAKRSAACESSLACYPRDGRSLYALIARAGTRKPLAPAALDQGEIVVANPVMIATHKLVERFAASDIDVLVLGETGVGKDVIARRIHGASRRASGPFIEINCAALSDTLIDSELFGHEKGAFTGAVGANAGLLEAATGGTVFLDEVGEMSPTTQAKILRVIEDHQVRRVGGIKARKIDVRIIAATNRDLEAEVARGAFRQDLYFRLNAATISVPPLRERTDEIEPLALTFLAHATRESGGAPEISAAALQALRAYRWPGNIRELRHVIELAVLMSGKSTIDVEHLPPDKLQATFLGRATKPMSSGRPAAKFVDQKTENTLLTARPRGPGPAEREWILAGLERANGNQTIAAKLLGISRRTLINRMETYQLDRPRKRSAVDDESTEPTQE